MEQYIKGFDITGEGQHDASIVNVWTARNTNGQTKTTNTTSLENNGYSFAHSVTERMTSKNLVETMLGTKVKEEEKNGTMFQVYSKPLGTKELKQKTKFYAGVVKNHSILLKSRHVSVQNRVHRKKTIAQPIYLLENNLISLTA